MSDALDVLVVGAGQAGLAMGFKRMPVGPAPSERRKPMKAIVQDTYGKADVLELRDIDKPVQDTYGSADVQTATGGTR